MLLPLLILALGISATPAHAHIRWFVTAQEADLCVCHPHPTLVASLLFLAGLGSAALTVLYRRYGRSFWFTDSSRLGKALPLLTLPLGFTLLLAAAQGFFRSPDASLSAGLGEQALRVLEALTGLALLSGRLPRLSAVGLLVLFWSGFAVADPEVVMENVDLLGFAAFLALLGTSRQGLALPALRGGVGATLVVLGLSEKLMHPALSVVFLHKHPWNFVPGMSDTAFVYAAGTVEVLVGCLVALGSWPRFSGAVILALMTLTMALLGPQELVGHLPYMALATVEMLEGCPRLSALVHLRRPMLLRA